MVKKYTSMAYAKADDMLFGNAKFPVKAGLGLEIGAGFTTPEVNYAPRPEAGKSKDKLIKEYERITTDTMARMVQIGAPSIVLETEHVEQMSNNPEWGGAVAHAQKTIMEEYHDEYGIKCALRHTIGDIREDRDYLQLRGDKYTTSWKPSNSVPRTVQTCFPLRAWVVRKYSTTPSSGTILQVSSSVSVCSAAWTWK